MQKLRLPSIWRVVHVKLKPTGYLLWGAGCSCLWLHMPCAKSLANHASPPNVTKYDCPIRLQNHLHMANHRHPLREICDFLKSNGVGRSQSRFRLAFVMQFLARRAASVSSLRTWMKEQHQEYRKDPVPKQVSGMLWTAREFVCSGCSQDGGTAHNCPA